MKLSLILIPLLLLLSACASQVGGGDYAPTETRGVEKVWLGTVLNVQAVSITAGSNSGTTGAVAGGIGGGIVGSSFGSGKGNLLATLAGALTGGLLGHSIASHTGQQAGDQLTVRLQNHQVVAITQGLIPHVSFSIGEAVEVTQGTDGVTRVQPFPTATKTGSAK